MSRQPRISSEQLFARIPYLGEKVTVGHSGTIYTVNRVSADGRQVNLHLEGTNIERFRVSVDDLNFIEKAPPPSRVAKPTRKTINVEEVREHLATSQHSNIDQLKGDIAILKKYLKSKGVSSAAIEELDSLCEDMEERWKTAAETISVLLDEID